MIDRRQLLGNAAAVGAAAALPISAHAAAPVTAGADFRALTDRFVDTALALAPETATTLGLDHDTRAALKARLNDRSEAGRARAMAANDQMRRELASTPRARLSGADLTLYDTVAYSLGLAHGARRFRFGDNGFDPLSAAAAPYVVSQQNGDYAGVPEFLDTQHQIEGRADVDAYLARLDAFGPALTAENTRIAADASRGVIPPSFILDTTLGQLKKMRATPAAQQKMVTSVANRAAARGIAGDWGALAARIVEARVYPALDGQIAALEAARARADDRAGVWKLPDGDAYYAWALRCGTTTNLSADAVHATGLAQTRELQAAMDAGLRAQGLTAGSVGERLSALTRDPRYRFADTADGRTQVVDYINGRIARMRPMLARLSRLRLKAEVQVKAVPADIQDGAALGYMNPASLDGARPAIYYVNLKTMDNWPRWTLPTLSAHEAIPGHAFQFAFIAENGASTPRITSLLGFNAFVEGWALYSEQMADEIGYYADDPLGRLGMQQALNFRAARLVVDTGLHAKRWTRAQAIDWMIANTGRSRAAVTSEVDRYCVAPGQACGYKVGHNEILRLRTRARTALGARFDLRDFNDALVTTGGAPLAVLGPVVDRYVARVGRG